MKNLLKRLSDLFAAIAFAESGEFETAKKIAARKQETVPQKRIPKLRL